MQASGLLSLAHVIRFHYTESTDDHDGQKLKWLFQSANPTFPPSDVIWALANVTIIIVTLSLSRHVDHGFKLSKNHILTWLNKCHKIGNSNSNR